VDVQVGNGEYVVRGRTGREGGDESFGRRGALCVSDPRRSREASGLLKEDRPEDAKLRLLGERVGSWRRRDLYALRRYGSGDSLTGVQYRSQVSFSVCKAAISASEGLGVRWSSKEVSEPDELNGSYIIPGSELSDEMERRF
jgi:hypothetical protein